jgi:DNA-binding SARP family transcriptional activator
MPILRLLGRPRLVAEGDVPVTGRPAQRHSFALLALLAGEPRGLSRDRLIAYLWPDHPEAAGRHRLSVTLHQLRRRLGPEALAAAGDGLALDPGHWQVDAWRFEACIARGEFEAAAAEYGGPLLDGFFLTGSPAFEQWLDGWRSRLARRHLAVLDSLAQEAEVRGDTAVALEYLQELQAREPFSSARTIALMNSLAAAGEPEHAIRCSRAYALTVREDYGLDPDPAVLACAEAVARDSGRGRPRL